MDDATNGVIAIELLGGCRTEPEYERLGDRLGALLYLDTDRKL